MSAYALNKMLREVNQNSASREAFKTDPAAFASRFPLSDEERAAFLAGDIRALYRLGAHGLILRPFTLLSGMPEPDYLHAIRG